MTTPFICHTCGNAKGETPSHYECNKITPQLSPEVYWCPSVWGIIMWSHMMFVHSVRSLTTTYWKIYGFSSTNAMPCLAMLVKVMTNFRILKVLSMYIWISWKWVNGLSVLHDKQTEKHSAELINIAGLCSTLVLLYLLYRTLQLVSQTERGTASR